MPPPTLHALSDALALARILLFFAAFGLVPLASLLGQRPRLDLRTGSGADSVRDAVEAGDHAAKHVGDGLRLAHGTKPKVRSADALASIEGDAHGS
jgi:hypothetical protein